jgi:hypothetical protein
MAIPVPEDLGRAGSAIEGTFKGTPGTIVNHGGLWALDPVPDRTGIAKSVLRNSEKDGFADETGYQSFTLNIEHQVTDLLVSSLYGYTDWLKTSLGEEVAPVTLAAFASGLVSSVTCGATTFDDILKIVAVDTFTYHVPLKTKSGTVATFAFLLPSAAAGATKPKNASETGGKAWRDKKDGTVNTHQFVIDQGGYAGETWLKAQGAVPSSPFELIFTPNGLLRLKWGWQAAIWTSTKNFAGASPSGLVDALDNTEGYISDVVSCAIQDLTTPVALVPLAPKAMKLTCGYGFDPRTGGQGATPALAPVVPGSNKTGFNRRNSGVDMIEITIDDSDWMTWDQARINKTPFFFWVEFQPGNAAGAVGASRLCIFKPRVKVRSAKPVKVDGMWCTALQLQVERQSGMKREYVSFFGTT